jgi:16S rRNA (uracil1498-N3)-methyltransferase
MPHDATFTPDLHAFFAPDIPHTIGAELRLDPSEARHARATRCRPGDRILLLDGNGVRSRAVIALFRKEELVVTVEETAFDEAKPGLYIDLAFGILADRGRSEWLLEKSVELGVRRLYPLQTARSEGRFNRERGTRIAIAALKQSQRSFLPIIGDAVRWDALEDVAVRYDHILLCHEDVRDVPAGGSVPLIEALDEIVALGRERSILGIVGPEGGFDPDEVTGAIARMSARPVWLGPARLRAETAGVTLLATMSQVALRGTLTS